MGPNMPSVSASVFCEPPSTTTTTCSDAIRDSLAATKSAYVVDRGLQSAVKRTQMSKIEYEVAPPDHHNNVIDTLKAKYTVLAANNGAAATTTANNGSTPAKNNMGNSGSSNASASTANGSGNQLPTPKRCLFQRNLVQIGWKHPGGRHWSTGSGMSNVGNTCYLNSTLQALFHVPSFANFLYSDDEHRKRCEETNSQTECIICSMARTLNDTQTQGQCVKPYRVYSKLRQICRHLVQGHQEDAHEFLRYLVEAMEKAYLLRFKNSKEFDQYTKETTPLNQILGGYLKSSVRCLDCGHVSVTFQHFQDLLLDIRKSSSIDEALDTHFARERLEDMGYKCEACKKKVSATKQFSLERAPIALCIQLKRFSMMGGKMNKHVSFSPRLNLSKYSARRAQTGDNADPQMIYRLVSMVTHLGSSQHCGHYTAVGLTSSGAYFTFDDSSVRPIAQQNVLQTNAYIMFYELEDPAAIRNADPTSYQQTAAAHASPMQPKTPHSAVDDSKKSFIGPVMPAAEAKTNGTPATPSTASSNGHNVPKPTSKLVLNISSSNTPIKTWSGSKLVPTPVRNLAATNGHAPQTATTTPTVATNGHHHNGHLNNGAGLKLKPNIASTANSSATGSNTTAANTPSSLQARSTTKLPTPPAHHTNGHAHNGHKASNGVATPPSSPDVATAPKPPQVASTTTAAKTNGHQPRVTNGFTTSSAAAGRPLVPYDDDSSDAAGQSEDDSAADKTPPTIKTKAGVFQVTTVVANGPPTAAALQSQSTPSPASGNGGDKTHVNAFKKRPASADGANGAAEAAGSTVASKLMKMSHRGYGVEVSTWGGQASSMDQELKEDRLAEQRRRQEIDVDADMDAGRQKKVKAAQPMAGPSNPGFNVFQGTQNNINNGQHRWTSNFHNRKQQKPNGHGFGANRHKHHQQPFKHRHPNQHYTYNNQNNHNNGRPRPPHPPRD